MKTVVVGQQPGFDDWLWRRWQLGQDKRDEIWNGVYHVSPLEHMRNGLIAMELAALLQPQARDRGLRATGPFNLGEPDNYRCPDLGVIRCDQRPQVWNRTAALVVEILSPDDESWDKLPHYAGYGVDEVWMVDPRQCSVSMLVLQGQDYLPRAYLPSDTSVLLSISAAQVTAAVDWPQD